MYNAIDTDVAPCNGQSNAADASQKHLTMDESKNTSGCRASDCNQSVGNVLVLSIVEDMLDSLNLNYTSSVFKSEIGGNNVKYKRKSRQELKKLLQLKSGHDEDSYTESDTDPTSTQPQSVSYSPDSFNQNDGSLQDNEKINSKKEPVLLQLLQKVLGNEITNNYETASVNTSTDTEHQLNNATFVSTGTISENVDIPAAIITNQ